VLALWGLALGWIMGVHGIDAPFLVVWIPLVSLAAGLLLKIAQTKNTGYPSRWLFIPALLILPLFLGYTMFRPNMGWYHPARGGGWDRALAGMNTALALTSFKHIDDTLTIDDYTFRELGRLTAGAAATGRGDVGAGPGFVAQSGILRAQRADSGAGAWEAASRVAAGGGGVARAEAGEALGRCGAAHGRTSGGQSRSVASESADDVL
jgi:hypothetical protein